MADSLVGLIAKANKMENDIVEMYKNNVMEGGMDFHKDMKVVYVPASETPEIDYEKVYMSTSKPGVWFGKKNYVYETGDRDYKTGDFTIWLATMAISLNEREFQTYVMKGPTTFLQDQVDEQLDEQNIQFMTELEKYAVNPWAGATTDDEYDSSVIGLLTSSSTGTVANPADWNSTAGTAENLAAVNFSGTNQSQNAVLTVALAVKKGMKKKRDYINKRQGFVTKQINCYVHPDFKAILDVNTEVLNSTTGQRTEQTMSALFANQGITIRESYFVDYDYDGDSGDTSQMFFVAQPSRYCIRRIYATKDVGWQPWEPITKPAGDGKFTKLALKTFQFRTCYIFKSIYVRTSNTAGKFYKPVFVVTATPYENS